MKTTFPPHARALLHQTPAGAVVIVETAQPSPIFLQPHGTAGAFGMGGNTPAASNG